MSVDFTENVQRMKENGFIVTGPGNMMCGRILHIKARSKLSSWEETVKVCLKTVEDKGASSVSFPALGTGKVLCLLFFEMLLLKIYRRSLCVSTAYVSCSVTIFKHLLRLHH